jgi:hypothetical protein
MNLIKREWHHGSVGGFCQASTTTNEDSKPAGEVAEGITLIANCIWRVQEIKYEDGPKGDNKMLRLSAEGGGCSGLLYNFSLDDAVREVKQFGALAYLVQQLLSPQVVQPLAGVVLNVSVKFCSIRVT